MMPDVGGVWGAINWALMMQREGGRSCPKNAGGVFLGGPKNPINLHRKCAAFRGKDFRLYSNCMEYDRGNSFPFHFEPKLIQFLFKIERKTVPTIIFHWILIESETHFSGAGHLGQMDRRGELFHYFFSAFWKKKLEKKCKITFEDWRISA